MPEPKKTNFVFHTDPSHGWLEVLLGDAQAVGLTVYDFSHCSYVRDGMLYLEEDQDAGVFLEAFKAEHGADALAPFEEIHTDNNHWIRALDCLPPNKADS